MIRRARSTPVVLSACILTVAVACGVPDRPLNTHSSDSSNGATPYTACLDFSDAVAQTYERCGLGTYDEGLALITAAAGGDCHNVVGVRDMASLYDQCIPWWLNTDCSQLSTGNLDPSCSGQLLTSGGTGA